MRAWLVFLGGVVAALLSVWALAHVLPESWSLLPPVLYGVIVMGSGLGSQLIKRHRARTSRSADEGSVEREIAQRAASETFGAALVAMVVFGLYLIGIAMAVLTGLVLKHSMLRGEATPFIMELPPYHMPTLRGVLLHTWDRLKSFIVRAGRVIVPMVLVLNVLNAVGTDGSFGNEDSDRSMLASVGRTIAPAFAPMGLDEDNWPAAVGIFTGVLAKEAVVGTLDSAYTALDAEEAGAEEGDAEPFALGAALSEALATIPANLGDALTTWGDPLGIEVGDLTDTEEVAEEQEVSTGTFGAMASRFDGAAGAFAYLVFILLYFPCTAAIAAIYQESGTRWTVFVAAWTTGLGYGLATLSYQVGTWSAHPGSSLAWSVVVVAAFALAVFGLRRAGQRTTVPSSAQPQQA